MGSDSKIVFRPLPTDDPKIRQPDISRARMHLGWEPKVNRHDGLSRVIHRLKQNHFSVTEMAVQHI
jgi:dTDP-glucose 4,6-dehydratase